MAEEDFTSQSLMLEVPESNYLGVPDLSPSCSSWSDNYVYATDSTTGSLSPYPQPSNLEAREENQVSNVLSSQDLELLSHYITHTSRVIPYDQEDLYALHVGIPNLAFSNKPLMASILALSAACKSHDIVQQSPEPLERLDELHELLSLADKHHRTSLHQIQGAIRDKEEQYDPVLANAALMVLYGSSSHCVRVLLTQMATRRGIILDDELLPTQSQWITLIRAAHTAYTGLLNGPSEQFDNVFGSPSSGTSASITFEAPATSVDNVYFPEDGPSEGTKRFLFPIVSATYGPAVDKLIARAQVLETRTTSIAESSHASSCFASLDILQDIYSTVFLGKETTVDAESPFFYLGRLQSVSPWLRSYLGRVTSSTSPTPSKPLRRTIMAFLNRVPLEYLHLVQSMLDRIPVVGHVNCMDWDVSMSAATPTQQLAIDIFAHWLILVMLLDGVWWIGGIGEWELGRVLSFADAQGWGIELTEPGERWWPESMYNVKKELAEHVGRPL